MSAISQRSGFTVKAKWVEGARVGAACVLLAALTARVLLPRLRVPAPSPIRLHPTPPRPWFHALPPDNVIVAQVMPGSAGAKAGLREGDVLVSYAGRPLASPFAFLEAAQNASPASKITVAAKRGVQTIPITMPAGMGGVIVRPVLSQAMLTLYQAGLRDAAVTKGASALAKWRMAYQMAESAGDANAGGWLAYILAEYCQKPELGSGGQPSPEAQSWLQCAWECVQGENDRAAQASVLMGLGGASFWAGNTEAADGWFEQAYCAAPPDSDPVWAAGIRAMQGLAILSLCTPEGTGLSAGPSMDALTVQKSLAKARFYLSEAVRFYRKAPSDLQTPAMLLQHLGLTAQLQGKPADAQGYYEQSLALYQRFDPRSAGTADMLLQLGSLAVTRGDAVGAQRYLRASLALSQGSDTPSQQRRSAIYFSLGPSLMMQGDLEQAKQYLQQSLAACSQTDLAGLAQRLKCLTFLGQIAALQKRLPEAKAYCDQALAFYRQSSLLAEQQASTLNTLGLIAALEKQYPVSRRRFEEALHIWQAVKPGGSEGMGASLNGLGMAAYNGGDMNEARVRFQQARDIWRKCASGVAQEGVASANLGRVYLRQNQPRLALPLIEEAIARLESRRTRLPDLKTRSLFMEQYGSPFADLMQTYVMLGQPDQAFDTLERMRARSFADKLAAARQRSGQDIAQPRPIDLQTAQRALPAGVLALSYGQNGDSVYLFALTNADFHVYTLPVSQERLTARIEQARDLIADAHSTAQMTDGILTDLYDNLMRPAQAEITRARSLVICPPDGLNLPFAALKPAPGRYLIEDKPITTVASLTVYRSLRAYTPPARPSLLALGDPAYNTAPPLAHGVNTPSGSMGNVMQRLPETGRAAQTLSALYAPRSTVLLQKQATPARFLAQSATASLIHVGCHAAADPQNPFGSSLALTPDAHNREGRLYASQILSQKLNARLVVLWGCGTALGKQEKYEGIEGLGRAFQTAGARNVLTTLWEVQPQETAPIIENFYRAYRNKTGSASIAASLRQAQIAALKTDPRPYTWASFVLDGVGE